MLLYLWDMVHFIVRFWKTPDLTIYTYVNIYILTICTSLRYNFLIRIVCLFDKNISNAAILPNQDFRCYKYTVLCCCCYINIVSVNIASVLSIFDFIGFDLQSLLIMTHRLIGFFTIGDLRENVKWILIADLLINGKRNWGAHVER